MKEVKDILYEIYDNYSSVDHKICLHEDLPKEIKREIYGKEYFDRHYEEVDIYSILKNDAYIDIHKASFKKVEREDFLKLIQTGSVPAGSIIYGKYKGASIIIIKRYYGGWKINISEEYFERFIVRKSSDVIEVNLDTRDLKKDICDPLESDSYRGGHPDCLHPPVLCLARGVLLPGGRGRDHPGYGSHRRRHLRLPEPPAHPHRHAPRPEQRVLVRCGQHL